MEQTICEIRHHGIDKKLEAHEGQLKEHDKRIGDLEKYQSKAEQQIEQLCTQIKALVKAIWWGYGLAASALLGFFIWYVQGLRG